MEKKNIKKCSMDEHSEIDAILYCQDCNIYICKDCDNYHSKIFKNHRQYKIDYNTDMNELFIGLCKEYHHFLDLKYYQSDLNLYYSQYYYLFYVRFYYYPFANL